jgi:hypothetical protein
VQRSGLRSSSLSTPGSMMMLLEAPHLCRASHSPFVSATDNPNTSTYLTQADNIPSAALSAFFSAGNVLAGAAQRPALVQPIHPRQHDDAPRSPTPVQSFQQPLCQRHRQHNLGGRYAPLGSQWRCDSLIAATKTPRAAARKKKQQQLFVPLPKPLSAIALALEHASVIRRPRRA